MICSKIPRFVDRDRTLRIKIIDTCGMTCTFCHNEGTPVTVDNRKGHRSMKSEIELSNK